MATRKNFKMTIEERRMRNFSESFKIKKVREIEMGITRISELCKEYEVSTTSIYAWLNKYGIMKNKKEKFVIQSQSDTQELLHLRQKIAELERTIGQKQLLIEFKDKMIDIAEDMYGVDIKKKLSDQLLNTTGLEEKKTNGA